MTFQPGQSGNPVNTPGYVIPLKNGRKLVASDKNKIRAMYLIDRYTPKAVAELCKLISVGDARVRIRAIELLLAYGLGKPKETVQITGADGADLMPSITINVGSARTEISDARGNVVEVQAEPVLPAEPVETKEESANTLSDLNIDE